MGGFECSTHKNKQGLRLDMIAATEHDKYVLEDYERLSGIGINTVRDGIRWHVIEKERGQFDFSSVLPMIRAANKTGTQIIWDLCHYGWPSHIDIFKPEFISSLASLAREFLRVLTSETDAVPFITPINEISYFSWACGQIGYMYPYHYGKGYEVKLQLVRATIEATEAIWDVAPQARIVNVDPAIHVVADPSRVDEYEQAIKYNEAQYEARDMLIGKLQPELGGAEKYLDIIGANFYPFSQWISGCSIIGFNHLPNARPPIYKPFSEQLAEIYNRYHRPLFISETGAEADARVEWLQYIVEQVQIVLRQQIPLKGICWYPIVNNPHWDTGRHCTNGCWDYADETGKRASYTPLVEELRKYTESF